MGRKCYVPSCRSNYDNSTPHVTVFQFPSDEERRALWVRSIRRDSFVPSKTAVVSIKHFIVRFIRRENSARRSDGSIISYEMKRPCLTEDAYPSLNENLPAYYSSEPAMKRRCPDQRRQEILLKEAETQREMEMAVAERDVISTYENLLAYVKDYD